MARLNKSLVFKRAWATYKLKIKHNCGASFAYELSNCYKIARLIGYANYRPSVSEDTYKSNQLWQQESGSTSSQS